MYSVILTSMFCMQASLAGCSKLGEGTAGAPGETAPTPYQ